MSLISAVRIPCHQAHTIIFVTVSIALSLSHTACTGQIPESFRVAQQEQAFDTALSFNTKVDLLWVVDNSSSMDVSQNKLRQGFTAFAQKYMQPSWDIRVAVVTTDTYLANSAFSTYLDTVVPGTTGYTSPTISARLGTWTNPSWNTSLVNLATGAFDSGVKYKELVPLWGPNYARIEPGIHDGPVTGLCFEALPYFLSGNSDCAIRDSFGANTGTSGCLNPGGGESAITQCVNTVQNDTVRSGRAIINTKGASVSQLVDDFMINVSRGTVGHGSERGFGSVLQVIADNEGTSTKFFRPDSIRGIIFVSDEDDQTLDYESSLPAGFNPWTHYQCDQAGLVALNPGSNITGANGNCCSGGSCRFGSEGTTCASKTVEGHTYTVSYCTKTSYLKPVSSVKASLDSYFSGLDGGSPNYFTVAITPLSASSIQTLQAARDTEDANVGGLNTIAVDRGDRYLELVNQVGNGSTSMDIGASDYSPFLESIGQMIALKRGTFKLDRAATSKDDMIVKVRHADGSDTEVNTDHFTVSGNTLQFTNIGFILSLTSTDRLIVNYQPTSLY